MKRLVGAVFLLLVAVALFSCAKNEKSPAGAEKKITAPTLALVDLNGNKVSIADYKGKVVMLEFFASWCPPCQMSAPEVESVYKKYKDKGFVVLGISIDEGANARAYVNSFMKDYGITYPVFIDDGSASRQYRVMSIPTSFVIDRQGNVRNTHIGLMPDMTNILSGEIEALL